MLPGDTFTMRVDANGFHPEPTHVGIGVELYDTHTGGHVCYLDSWLCEHLDGVEFMYSEGNYGCDCNRLLFVERAHGLEPTHEATPCGHSRVYVVRVVRRDTKAELYSGDEHPVVRALRGDPQRLCPYAADCGGSCGRLRGHEGPHVCAKGGEHCPA